MKGKLIITVGISNSGKSTWSHDQWANNPDEFVIVNRDKIRELLFGFTEPTIYKYYHTDKVGKFEKQVTRYEDTLIHEGLNHGKTVIVDATHLQRSYLERFKYWNVPVDVMVFEVDLETALERDFNRNRSVGERVIRKQYQRFVNLLKNLSENPIDFTPVTFTQNMDNEASIIFDIDGTLSHRGDRSPYEWLKVGLDTLDVPTKSIVDIINGSNSFNSVWADGSKFKVIICTGRDEESLEETEKWLKEYNIEYDEIYIRPKGDMRPDWIVKEEMWRKIAEDNYIVGMFDDRLQVVRRARALGLKVFNVEYNNF